MSDLFSHAEEARRRRDRGMAFAADAQDWHAPKWSERAYAALVELAKRRATIHIDDFLAWFPERPERPNASGSIWMRARRAGILVPTGQMRPCLSDPGKHRHQYAVLRSTIFQGRQS